MHETRRGWHKYLSAEAVVKPFTTIVKAPTAFAKGFTTAVKPLEKKRL